MSEEYGYTEAFKAQREAQSKFDYFFIGVTLVALSLSIETFKAENSIHPYLMILTWFLLLTSFLAGIYRQERITTFLAAEAEYKRIKAELDVFEKAHQKGEKLRSETSGMIITPTQLPKIIDWLKERSAEQDKYRKKDITRTSIAYRIQKWTFILAIISYMFFRLINLYPNILCIK